MSETDSPQVKIAVLNNDIKHINDTLTRLEGKFDTAINGFVTLDKLADAQQKADAAHSEIWKAINKLENWNTWAIRLVIATILAGIGVIVKTNVT